MGYRVLGITEVTCDHCLGVGLGCVFCHGGAVPVFTLGSGYEVRKCRRKGHLMNGHAEPIESLDQLPLVAWCSRRGCSFQQIQTDVPQAYDLEPRTT